MDELTWLTRSRSLSYILSSRQEVKGDMHYLHEHRDDLDQTQRRQYARLLLNLHGRTWCIGNELTQVREYFTSLGSAAVEAALQSPSVFSLQMVNSHLHQEAQPYLPALTALVCKAGDSGIRREAFRLVLKLDPAWCHQHIPGLLRNQTSSTVRNGWVQDCCNLPATEAHEKLAVYAIWLASLPHALGDGIAYNLLIAGLLDNGGRKAIPHVLVYSTRAHLADRLTLWDIQKLAEGLGRVMQADDLAWLIHASDGYIYGIRSVFGEVLSEMLRHPNKVTASQQVLCDFLEQVAAGQLTRRQGIVTLKLACQALLYWRLVQPRDLLAGVVYACSQQNLLWAVGDVLHDTSCSPSPGLDFLQALAQEKPGISGLLSQESTARLLEQLGCISD